MAITDRVKQAAKVLLGSAFGGSNQAVLDVLFAERQVDLLRGSWHPRHSAGSGVRLQWEHTCQCGMAHTILEAEKYRDYICSQCKKAFDFMGDTGVRLPKNKELRAALLRKLAPAGFTEADWSLHGADGDYLPENLRERLFRTFAPLPARGGNEGGPRVIDTWNSDAFDGNFQYEQSDYTKGH